MFSLLKKMVLIVKPSCKTETVNYCKTETVNTESKLYQVLVIYIYIYIYIYYICIDRYF